MSGVGRVDCCREEPVRAAHQSEIRGAQHERLAEAKTNEMLADNKRAAQNGWRGCGFLDFWMVIN
jgi:hypothetical protein